MSAPCDIAAMIAPAPSSGQRCASSITERMVRYMLVPVSPSGTGKTLIALTDSVCFSSQAAAAANISRSWPPESASMVTRVAMVYLGWGDEPGRGTLGSRPALPLPNADAIILSAAF